MAETQTEVFSDLSDLVYAATMDASLHIASVTWESLSFRWEKGAFREYKRIKTAMW